MNVERELVEVETAQLPRTGWGMALARGVYHRPSTTPKTAFLAVHYDLDFSTHYLACALAERGFGFLGWNTRFCGTDARFLLDRALVDIGLGVRWLREQGAEVVVLLGNSGGGPLLAAYQAQARQPLVRAPRGLQPAEGIDELPVGDLYVSLAAHPGRPEVLTHWLDPSVIDESDPVATDPALDMYNPDNGPPYGRAFLERYRVAQSERNRRISDWCRSELDRLERAGHRDRLFTVARTWADPRFLDPELDPSERPTPACYRGDPGRANRGAEGIGMVGSLRTWLGMWSLDERQCDSARALESIAVPALVIQALGDTGVFASDARWIHDRLGSPDKELTEMPGDHYFRGAGERAEVADRIVAWVRQRA